MFKQILKELVSPTPPGVPKNLSTTPGNVYELDDDTYIKFLPDKKSSIMSIPEFKRKGILIEFKIKDDPEPTQVYWTLAEIKQFMSEQASKDGVAKAGKIWALFTNKDRNSLKSNKSIPAADVRYKV